MTCATSATLFGTHNLPFQVIGVLILVATIGVVVLSSATEMTLTLNHYLLVSGLLFASAFGVMPVATSSSSSCA